MKRSFAIIPVLIFCACSNPEKENVTVKDPSEVSKSLNEKTPEITKWFKNTGAIPFTADTTLFNKIKIFDSLGTKEVKMLWINKSKENEYDLSEFYKIDSIKASGTYAKWCETLDIGMTKFANAYALNKIMLNENTTIFVWALVTSSYEACPYSYQVTIYFTPRFGNELGETFEFAEYLSAGDAPASLERTGSATLTAEGKITKDVYEVGDEDQDQPFINVTIEHYEYEIKDGKIILTKEKKEEPVKTKRPKQN